ncbi:beta-glucosidase [Sphaerotilus mobilis]|uniref:Beta-D-glucoside glucohydrolase n=1 Tax=Sphaerotilus mobilis TaxID=47994 RepID=A0A4Q7LCQ8_9BURK|nr:glycoside hydrolase family 3 C-terminal domain-containing protein [Sphaerotilus mobilis]RZS52175.1 beta-glucosidase [Sphaerotilus mobilis]
MTEPIDLDALLDAMTLDEQASLLSGADFWSTVAIPRLGVPAVKVTDGPNGARGGIFKDGPSTACFPVGIALAATWHPELIADAGAALGTEARLKGARVLLAPTVNLQRTVYNGRNFECHSEDPWLSSEMAVAYINGLQSTGVAATIKHYVGNESEFQRMSVSSDIPERPLRELYLLPFERAVKEAKVQCVMTGYNRVDGTFMADHHRLVTQVLRDEWGFDGLVMTDWMAHHDTVQSVLAGCDLEMPGPARERGDKLVAAVREGRLSADAIRACARRVLQLAERVGSFADPVIPAERDDDLPAHRALIRRLGAEGAVLLKNDANALPLAPQAGQTVALIGHAAVTPQIMGGGSANVNAHYRVSPLAGLQAACPGVKLVHRPGADNHRYTPLMPVPMTVSFWANDHFDGEIVATQTSPNTEIMWFGSLPAGLDPYNFSARTTLRFVAEADGQHAFSLISTGLARATLNGEAVLDAWTNWQRGDTYFTFGCDEVVHHRALKAGDVVDLQVEFSTAVAGGGFGVHALRVGASRLMGEADIAAAVDAARAADVAIVFAGLNAEWDNEGLDRPGIALPHAQNELIARVVAANPRTVVVLQSGSPLLLPWLDAVPAVLQAWYPGQECGNAIADVLTGAVAPGGRLPQTWPLRLDDTVAFGDPAQYPGVDGHVRYGEDVFIGYRHHEARGHAVLFPFGHGLGYTSFEQTGLTLDRTVLQPGEVLSASVTVRNTGTRAGSEVVQLYVHDAASTLARPPQELKAFAKLSLQPGESRTVRLTLDMRAFAAYDVDRAAWWAEAGDFEIRVGSSSARIHQRATVRLLADWREPVGR